MADSSVTLPNLGITGRWADGDAWGAKMNENLEKLDLFTMPGVKDKDLAAPPGSPAEGAAYIVAASPTGAWATHAKDIAVYRNAAWVFYTPRERWVLWVDDENLLYIFDGSNWLSYTPGGGGGGGGSTPGGQTRYCIIGASDFGTSPAEQEVSTGSGTEFLSEAFADTGDPELISIWVVPGDFSGLVDIKIFITDSGADTGNSQWLLGMEKMVAAGQADVSYTHTATIAIASPGANNKIAIGTFGSTGLTLTPGDVVKVKVARPSANPPDTATLAKRFLGILVTYTN